MTTPDGEIGGPSAASAEPLPKPRQTRPHPDRTGPRRARAGAAGSTSIAADRSPGETAAEATLSDSVAHAVKTGYDVIAENIKQGRIAAERFRQGEYNIREAPGDLEAAALRMIQLARELTTTTFDVCERLIREVRANAPGLDPAAGLPGFRAAVAPAAAMSVAPAPESGAMPVTVRFEGKAKARTHTTTLERPKAPTLPADLSAAPLTSQDLAAEPITEVAFGVDMAVEGLVVTITTPERLAPGVYSGLVRAKGQPAPLGVLSVEILK